jgi:hypothetical protein
MALDLDLVTASSSPSLCQIYLPLAQRDFRGAFSETRARQPSLLPILVCLSFARSLDATTAICMFKQEN